MQLPDLTPPPAPDDVHIHQWVSYSTQARCSCGMTLAEARIEEREKRFNDTLDRIADVLELLELRLSQRRR